MDEYGKLIRKGSSSSSCCRASKGLLLPGSSFFFSFSTTTAAKTPHCTSYTECTLDYPRNARAVSLFVVIISVTELGLTSYSFFFLLHSVRRQQYRWPEQYRRLFYVTRIIPEFFSILYFFPIYTPSKTAWSKEFIITTTITSTS